MRTVLTGLFLAALACGQSGTPDCQTAPASVSASGTVITIANKTTPCVMWRLTYWTNSATGVSLTLAGAPDVAGVPGSFTALTATQGSANPATATDRGQIAACCDYYPWIRISAGTLTGTGVALVAKLYGWKAPDTGPYSSSGTSGTQAVDIEQVLGATVGPNNPLPAGFRNSAGTITPEYCTSRVAFSNPGTGSTQLVAVSGSTTIRVCEFFFSGDTLSTMQLVTGTGSTCTSPTAETGIMSGAGGGLFGVALDFGWGALVTTAAKTLCLSLSAASTGGGYITYSQR